MQRDLRRGLLVGGLIALAIIGPLLYDDYVMHHNAAAVLGHSGAWLPLVGADFEVLLRAGFGLLLCGAIAWSFARGRAAWPVAVTGGVVAALAILDSTFEVFSYPGDATTVRMAVVPSLVAATIGIALVLAYRHRRAHQPRLASLPPGMVAARK
jgi:hypothetical protein